MAGIAITRMDLTAAQVRAAAAKARDARTARRMLAIALVLEGVDRKTAAETCGMDRQTLRDWVHRYNAEGLSGLSNRKSPGRQPWLTPAQKAALASLVEQGPDPERDGVVRWLAAQRPEATDRGDVRCCHAGTHGGRATGRTRLRAADAASPSPEGRRSGPGGIQKNFPDKVAAVLPAHARGKPIEIWFQDEARVGQQGTLTRVWARRGTRPRGPRDRRYKWAYLFGAVCPARAACAALVLPKANAEALSLHLAEISRQVAAGAHAVLVLDGAGWHIAQDLIVPDNLTLLHLPPYAPELNPVENVWEYLRKNKLAITVFDGYGDIIDKCCQAWNFFANDKSAVASITSRKWAQVKL